MGGMDRLIRADAATEVGLARFLEQYARLLAGRRRRDGIGPADAYNASKTLASAAALLRFHLQKSALYGAAASVLEPDEPDAANRLSSAARSMRALLLASRVPPATSAQANASLADLEAFYARKRETGGNPESAPPSPPWIHPKVTKT
jgi:hypothetical protein